MVYLRLCCTNIVAGLVTSTPTSWLVIKPHLYDLYDLSSLIFLEGDTDRHCYSQFKVCDSKTFKPSCVFYQRSTRLRTFFLWIQQEEKTSLHWLHFNILAFLQDRKFFSWTLVTFACHFTADEGLKKKKRKPTQLHTSVLSTVNLLPAVCLLSIKDSEYIEWKVVRNGIKWKPSICRQISGKQLSL